ncbi:adenylate/guanylate cyclase domain-containing protein [Microvirga massiliensis]|uniref:adenylate/guanylate cyclase domain-containing protein n=1 Tax=Microvirga massiliensis TaxID=1033741 RepID=UPI00062BE01D|nr:adenylate/guanylate cyclase domain-containing protein [Microvirga massiliensis]
MGPQEHRVERRLAAIFAADVAGYSRLMEQNEVGTLRTLTAHRAVMDRLIAEHGGRIANTAGDSVLAEFPSAVDAVQCAVLVQERLAAASAGLPEDRMLKFRIGVHIGDVMVRSGDLLGDGVNIAARLEQMADPGGICVSAKVYDEIERKLDHPFEYRGEQQVKNIARPIKVYALAGPASTATEPRSLSLPEKPSIAVLPFTNMSGDPEQEYFAEGIAEEITTALARLRGFFVISRNSAFTYKGKTMHIQQVGRDLGVRYVLEGSVRKARDRIRVGVQLADAVSGREIWSERYDRALVDVFALQDEIAASVVVTVEPQLYFAERERVQLNPPGRLDAWDCVIRALSHMWLRTKADTEAALAHLESALRLDPKYARALGLHAWLNLWHAHQGWSPGGLAGVLPSATERARAAVSIDGDDAWARLALGFAQMFHREHESAVEEFRAALELNPNFALAHACLGLTLAYGGRGPEAVAQVEQAMRLSPRDPFVAIFIGARSFAHFMAGDYAAGLEWGRRAVRQSPDYAGHWRALALSAAMLGHTEEAKAAVATARQLQPDYSVEWVERASPLVHAADRSRYCEVLRPVGLPES